MPHPKKEQTLILVKPDGLQRGLTGEVIKRFEARGLKLVGVKMVKPTVAHTKKHYLPTRQQLEGMGNKTLDMLRSVGKDPKVEMGTDDPMAIGKIINSWNFEFLSSGPVVALVFQGPHAAEMGRKIVGNTLPFKAEIGTIRADFSVDSPILANLNKRPLRNIVHASGDAKEGRREVKHWFSAKELFDYKRVDEGIMFD